MNKLSRIEKTAVYLSTQDEYDQYMKMCDDVGWTWGDGQNPIEYDLWVVYKSATCITIGNGIQAGSINSFREEYFEIITLKELKERFNMFSKDNIKSGQVVKFRNGEKGIVILIECCTNERIIVTKEEGWIPIFEYLDDLTLKGLPQYDIMEIYIPNKDEIYPMIENGLIWERKPEKMTEKEVCEELGREVEIVKDDK